MKQNIVFLYSSLKVEKIINESDTDDFLNQFKLRLYQTYKIPWESFALGHWFSDKSYCSYFKI